MNLKHLISEGCCCFNCGCSHLFGEKLKCSLNAKSDDGSDYDEVDEDSVKDCWTEKRNENQL